MSSTNIMTSNIYCIITTSLIQDNSTIRKQEYIKGILSLINKCSNSNIKVIIVENNNLISSFLDDFNVDVNYTDTNNMPTTNYGIKEIHDVLKCIEKYNIKDDDYVIKMTGRYYLSDTSPFFDEICKLDKTNYEVIIKYGWWGDNKRIKHENCFTGLICMKAKYIKQIDIPNDIKTCIEIRWAKVTIPLEDSKICALDKLGLYMCPKCNNNTMFFEV